jgi:phosphate transport system substrate-binding protein
MVAAVSGLIALLLLVSPAYGQSSWEPRKLTANLKGSGATFPNPVYQTWISVYKNVNPNVTISYQSVGSGQGQTDFVRYLTDFGGTDSILSDARIKAEAPDTLHIPTVLGAVVPTYNLGGVTAQLRFSPDTLANIYLGKITNWNDSAIAADNPTVRFPKRKITVVYRSDGSGTTAIWTDYLAKVSTDWKTKVGAGTTVNWPAGIGSPGNAGVTSTVLRTDGAIGYVELVYALGNKLPVPLVENAAGNFVAPTLENVSAAAAGVEMPDDLRISITNAKGANSYPIAAFTYILVHQQTYTDLPKAQALTDFIYWGITEGQGASLRLGYSPLPDPVRKKAIEALRKVVVNGKKAFEGPVK